MNGTIADLYDGMLMKDMDKAVEILSEKIKKSDREASIELERTQDIPVSYTHLDVYKRQTKGSNPARGSKSQK